MPFPCTPKSLINLVKTQGGWWYVVVRRNDYDRVKASIHTTAKRQGIKVETRLVSAPWRIWVREI